MNRVSDRPPACLPGSSGFEVTGNENGTFNATLKLSVAARPEYRGNYYLQYLDLIVYPQIIQGQKDCFRDTKSSNSVVLTKSE